MPDASNKTKVFQTNYFFEHVFVGYEELKDGHTYKFLIEGRETTFSREYGQNEEDAVEKSQRDRGKKNIADEVKGGILLREEIITRE